MVDGRKKVFAALSGGVDSSVAAGLLLEAGFDCAGVFMITNDHAEAAQVDAQKIAEKLGIKLYVLDVRSDFESVLDYFCNEYKRGRTPNPCVFCNRYIKFGKLWDFARANGADLLATGHYARILGTADNTGLYEAADSAKDQSYVLAMVDRNILPSIILPMGNYSKDRTREIAAKLGLSNAEKPESQEICFITDDDYVAVLENRCPDLVRKGNIFDSSGKVLGEHKGVHKFTIGQRRGLQVAMGKPYYVARIDAESNTVTLGPREAVMHRKLIATDVNWLTGQPQLPFQAVVKVRYNDKGTSGTVIPQGNSVAIEFDAPVSAITPGQLAAFYVRNGEYRRVIGGGWIDKVAD